MTIASTSPASDSGSSVTVTLARHGTVPAVAQGTLRPHSQPAGLPALAVHSGVGRGRPGQLRADSAAPSGTGTGHSPLGAVLPRPRQSPSQTPESSWVTLGGQAWELPGRRREVALVALPLKRLLQVMQTSGAPLDASDLRAGQEGSLLAEMSPFEGSPSDQAPSVARSRATPGIWVLESAGGLGVVCPGTGALMVWWPGSDTGLLPFMLCSQV